MESWHPVSKFLFLHLSHSSARSVEGSISDFDPGDREVRCAPGSRRGASWAAVGVPDQTGSQVQARKGWLQVGFETPSASEAKKCPQAALEAHWMTPTANLLS